MMFPDKSMNIIFVPRTDVRTLDTVVARNAIGM